MPAAQDRKQAYERRAWRLALLLTGNPAAAASIALDAGRRKDLASLPADRLDRLVIQHARELPDKKRGSWPTSLPTPDPQTTASLEFLGNLPVQPRDAFILERIDELDELHAARAMDCSKTALANHLAAADKAFSAAFGDAAESHVKSMRSYADSLDPDPAISAKREEQRRKRKQRRVLILILVIVGFLVVTAGVLGSG